MILILYKRNYIRLKMIIYKNYINNNFIINIMDNNDNEII